MGIIRRRDGSQTVTDETQDRALAFLYRTAPGRSLLKLLVQPWVSALGGAALDHPLSTVLIPGFVRHFQMDLSDYQKETYRSYNAFFTRQIRPEARPVDPDPAALISPCDAKLTVYPITPDSCFPIKQSLYRTGDLLGCHRLARRFAGGQCLIFRLTVEDYHRYCYPEDGVKSRNRLLGSELHTVNPIALEGYNIYKRNCRSACLIRTARLGTIAMIEVGALMVGKIVNHHGAGNVRRGAEKGMFRFGGSTVVVLLQKDAAVLDPDILQNSAEGVETAVHYGERIGTAQQCSHCLDKQGAV